MTEEKTGPLQLMIEDTGLGVTIDGEPNGYRIWKVRAPYDANEFLMLSRSVIANGGVPRPAKIAAYVEMTPDMISGPASVFDILEEVERKTREATSPPAIAPALREALMPFLEFASGAVFEKMPDNMQMTVGSPLARKQIKASHFRALLRAMAATIVGSAPEAADAGAVALDALKDFKLNCRTDISRAASDALKRLEAALKYTPTAAGIAAPVLYRHKVRGSTYRIVAREYAQETKWEASTDRMSPLPSNSLWCGALGRFASVQGEIASGAKAVFYQAEDKPGRDAILYARTEAEFFDGRFELVEANSSRKPGYYDVVGEDDIGPIFGSDENPKA